MQASTFEASSDLCLAGHKQTDLREEQSISSPFACSSARTQGTNRQGQRFLGQARALFSLSRHLFSMRHVPVSVSLAAAKLAGECQKCSAVLLQAPSGLLALGQAQSCPRVFSCCQNPVVLFLHLMFLARRHCY